MSILRGSKHEEEPFSVTVLLVIQGSTCTRRNSIIIGPSAGFEKTEPDRQSRRRRRVKAVKRGEEGRTTLIEEVVILLFVRSIAIGRKILQFDWGKLNTPAYKRRSMSADLPH